MVTRQKSEARQKTQLIQVRATPEEKAKLKAHAAAFGVSVGELCRQAVFGSLPKAKTDQEAIQALAVARADLGRVGGLLKGWLSGAFPNAPVPTAQDQLQVRDLLKKLEAGQATVIASVKKITDRP